MTELVSDSYRNIALLSEKIKAPESSLNFHKGLEGIAQAERDVELSRQKLQAWRETWSGQDRSLDGKGPQSDIISKALWGVQGWENIQRILVTIKRAREKLEAALQELLENANSPPRNRWKAAVRALRSKKLSRSHSKDQNLKELAAELNENVDELWLYTETVFDSLHGVMAQDLKSPSRDRLLQSALHSRAVSLDTYWLCAKYPLDWSLEMNLLDARTMPFNSFEDRANASLHPSYHLFFTQTGDDSTNLHEITLENVPRQGLSLEQVGDVMQPDEPELQTPNLFSDLFSQNLIRTCDSSTVQHGMTVKYTLEGSEVWGLKRAVNFPRASEPQMHTLQNFKPNVEDGAPVPVTSKDPRTLSSLGITVMEVHLKSSPETLASILKTLKDATNNLSVHDHFSVGAKVELAYNVVECGFFLLGTPWFSSLRSMNILRMKSTGGQRHKFMLRIQTLDMHDLLFDDAEALTEASQLHRIGVLLMEIALDSPEVAMPTEDYGSSRSRMSLLPLVEQSMGAQYCKATAFCLQYPQQQARFQGLSKYKSSHFQEWISYLAGFLEQYHSQVFLRLEELRDIDASSEYRSRKSWQIYK